VLQEEVDVFVDSHRSLLVLVSQVALVLMVLVSVVPLRHRLFLTENRIITTQEEEIG